MGGVEVVLADAAAITTTAERSAIRVRNMWRPSVR
jgi:hypothetical protein